MKYLIINADDFGHSKVWNQVILDLLKEEYVSSTSFMVDRYDKSQKDQVHELKKLQKKLHFSIGLHIEFKSTDYEQDIKRQYHVFIKLFGFKPNHLDIHKATHMQQAAPFLQSFGEANHIPCRNSNVVGGNPIMTDVAHFGGTWKTKEEIQTWLESLEDEKTYEIVFHPGKYDPESTSTLNIEREDDTTHIKEMKPLFNKLRIQSITYIDLPKIKKHR